MKEGRPAAQRARKVWIRPFLSRILGLSERTITYRFGQTGPLLAVEVAKYLAERGYVAPRKGERARKR